MKKGHFLGLSEEGFHKVAYTEWGKPNNTDIPIICVHGLSRNHHDFDSLAKHLAYLGSHLYCPDIVGRGDSDWLKNPQHYTYEQYISDMNAMIARTGAKKVDWIGTSMGGLLGMFLASMPNSPIRCLVLNDVGPQIPSKGIMRLSKYTGQDPDFPSIEMAKAYYKSIYADFGALTETDWQNFTEHSIREVSPGKYVSKMDPAVKFGTTKSKIAWRALLHPLKAIEGSLFDIDLWNIWRKVQCPVLVIHGKNSDILLSSTILKMKQTHAHLEVIEVTDAGHAPALLDEGIQETIYRWLMKHK